MNRKLSISELDRLTREGYEQANKTPLVVVLENIRSMNNVGSIFRTADAFLVEKICLCGYTATPPHRDIQKTALGATESVSWEHFQDAMTAVGQLQEEGYTVLAVEHAEETISLDQYQPAKGEKIAVVLGNEVEGVTQEVIDQVEGCLEIPQYGTKHSLNVSVCAGVVVWELFRKLKGNV